VINISCFLSFLNNFFNQNFPECRVCFLSDITRIQSCFLALCYLTTSCSLCSHRVTGVMETGNLDLYEFSAFCDEGNHFSSCKRLFLKISLNDLLFYSKHPRIADTCLCSWDRGRGGARMDLFMLTSLPNEFSSAVWNFVDFIIGSFIFQPTISKPRAKTAHWVIIS